jgi:hypothetical protein
MTRDICSAKVGDSPFDTRLVDQGPSQQRNHSDWRLRAEIAGSGVMAGESLTVPKRGLRCRDAPVGEFGKPDLHLPRTHQIRPRWKRLGLVDRREATSLSSLVDDCRNA